MATKKHNKRQTTAVSKSNNQAIKHTDEQIEYDDSFLPAAEELAKLKEIKPEIVDWILTTATKEQQARHRWNDDTMEMTSSNNGRLFTIDKMVIRSAVFITCLSMGLDGYLFYKEQFVIGTIFTGVIMVFCVSMLLNYRGRNRRKRTNSSEQNS